MSNFLFPFIVITLYLLNLIIFSKYNKISRTTYFMSSFIGVMILLFIRILRPFIGLYINVNSVSMILALLFGPCGVFLNFIINLIFL